MSFQQWWRHPHPHEGGEGEDIEVGTADEDETRDSTMHTNACIMLFLIVVGVISWGTWNEKGEDKPRWPRLGVGFEREDSSIVPRCCPCQHVPFVIGWGEGKA